MTGLKPTYGIVSLAGVVPLATTLDSVGPLARTAEDAALVMAGIAGPDPADPATLTASLVDFGAAIERPADIKSTRVTALAFEQLPANIDVYVLAAYAATMQLLRDLGAHVEEESFAFDLEDVMLRNGRIIAAEAYAVHRAYIEDAALEIDPGVRQRTLAGKSVSAAEYLDELAHRRHAAARFVDWMVGRDALLTPTLPITAVPVVDVDESATPLATFTRAANYLGACALSLPVGLSRAGLPIGIQLMGAAFSDATLIRVGRAIQRETSWHLRTPQIPVP